MDEHYQDDLEWPETVGGCLYELVTVGGAVILTLMAAAIVWIGATRIFLALI